MIKIYKNLDFRVNFRKCSVQFFGNIDIGQNFRKIVKVFERARFLDLKKKFENFSELYWLQSQCSKHLDYILIFENKKMTISDEIKKIDLSQNHRKISISGKKVEKLTSES